MKAYVQKAAALMFAFNMLAGMSVLAATYNWTPTASGPYNWNNAGSQNNWSSGFPNAAGDTANLNNDIAGAQVISLNQSITAGILNVGDSTSSYNAFTVQGLGGGLTLNNSGSGAQLNKTGSSTAADTIAASITLSDNVTVNVAQPLTIAGVIGETGGVRTLTKSTGTGVLTLSGANTYSGGTTLTHGTINIQNPTALGTGTLTINSGTTPTLNTISYGMAMTANNPQNWNANFTFTGTGSLDLGAGSVTMNATRTVTVSASTLTVGGVISGATCGLSKAGNGTLLLSGANSFSGPVTVSAGTLSITSIDNAANPNPLGQSANTAGSLILNGGTLKIAAAAGGTTTTMTTDRLFSLQASSTLDASGTAAVNFSNAGNLGFNGGTAAKTLTLAGDNPLTNTIAALIADNTGATSIIKSDTPATWVLTGPNTFTGSVAIRYSSAGAVPGTLVINAIADGGSPSPLGQSSSAAANLIIGQNTYPAAGGTGATLRYIGNGHSSNRSFTLENSAQTGGGTLDASGSGALNLTSTATPAFNTANVARTLVLSGSSTQDNKLSALLANNGSGAFNLIKTGQGRWILNGTAVNTYTGGTTINTGTLVEDYSNLSSGYANLINSGSALTFGGGTLSLLGKAGNPSTQGFTGNPTFGSNAGSGISITGGSGSTMTLTLANTWTRNAGSTVNITPGTGGTLTSSPTLANSIVVGSGNIAFATVAGADWATVSGGNIAAYSGYNTSFPSSGASSTVNYSLTGSGSVTASETANTLKISTSGDGQSLAITSGQTFTLNAGGLLFVGGNDYSITGGTLATGGSKDLVVHQFGAGNLTIGSTIGTGVTTLTKTGTGTLTLTGANTFTGATYAGGGGALVLKNQNALQFSALSVNNCGIVFDSSVGANAFTVAGLNCSYAGPGYDIALQSNAGSPAAIALTVNGSGTYNGTLSGPGSLIKSGAATTLTLNGFNTFTGGLVVNGGTVQGGLGNNWSFGPQGNLQITVNSGGTLQMNRTAFVGTLTLNGGTLASGNGFGGSWAGGSVVLQSTSSFAAGSGSVSVSAPISGSGGLTITGASVLSAKNTFTGDTKVTGNLLTISHALALQNSTLDTLNSIVSSSATTGLKMNAGVSTLTLGGLSGNKDLSTLFNSANGYTTLTTLTLNPNASQTPSYSAVIADGATGMSLIKTGAGTQTLSGASTYTGPTTISSGYIAVGNNQALGTNRVELAGGGLMTVSGSYTIPNALSLVSNATVNTMSSSSLTVGGVVASPGSLTKVGTGTLTLNSVNTYSGATAINAGTLALGAGGSVAGSPVIGIAGGATLDVSAATAATLGAGQTLQASGSTTGATLATAAGHGLTLNGSSPLTFTAFTPAGSGGAVPLTVAGAGDLTLGASTPVTITVSNSGVALVSGSYKLIATDGAGGAVVTLPSGLLTVNGDGASAGVSLQITGGELYLVVSSLTPTKLAIPSVNGGANTIAGAAFSLVVEAQDSGGTPRAVSADTAVTISLKTGAGVLGGTLSGTITNGTSSVTISGATYTKAEGGIVLTATRTSGDSLTPGDSASFTANAAAASTLTVSGFPSPQTAGAEGSVTVTVQDSYGNAATDYVGTVHFTCSDGAAVLPGDYGFAGGDAGVHTFSAAVTLKTAGTRSITVADTVTPSITGTQSGITVIPAAGAQVVFGVQPGTTLAGSAISPPVTVIVLDAYGNTATNDSSSVTIGSSTTAFTNSTLSVSAVGGMATFSAIKPTTPGSANTLTASDGLMTSATSTEFTVNSPTSFYWTNTVSGAWSTALNWTNAGAIALAPVAAGQTDYALSFNVAGTYSATNDLNDGFLLNQLTFGSPTLTVAGTNSLVFTDNGGTLPRINQNSGSTVTLSNGLALATNLTIGGTGNGQVVLSGVISGVGSMTKTNGGTLTINYGTNTYSGGTTVSAGTVTFPAFNVNTITLLGTGPVTINNATLSLNRTYLTNSLTLNGATVTSGNSFSSTLTAPITLLATSTFSITGGLSPIGGNIGGPGGLTKAGGSTVTLSGTNTYSGPTTINAGGLKLGATGSISNTPVILINPGGTFDVSDISAYTVSSSNTLSAAGTATAANLKAAAAGTANLGSRPVVLSYNGLNPALTVSQGTLVLNANPFTVNTASALAIGTYTIVTQTAGTITSSGTYPGVTGTAIGAGRIGYVTVSGANVTLNVAAPALEVSGFPSPQTAGVAGSVTVTAKDALGNTATAYTGTVHFACSDAASVLPSDYTFVPADNGTHTFIGGVTLKTAGVQSITVTDAVAVVSGTQSGIVVDPATAAALAVSGFPSPQPATFAASVTVTALDAYGNTATGYVGTVHFTSSDGVAGLPSDYTFVTGDNGTHSFTGGVTINTEGGPWTLTATDTVTGTITGTQSGITTISASTAVALEVTGFPSPQTAGVAAGVTVTAKDGYGNTSTNYTGTIHFTCSDVAASLPSDYTFVVGDNGTHTFAGGVTLCTAGPRSITATDTGTSITGTQSGISVTPAGAATLTVAGFPSPQFAGAAGSVTVTAVDAYGNTATAYGGTVHFTSSDGAALLPSDYAFAGGDNGVHAFTSGVTFNTPGTQSVTATDIGAGTITGTQSGITVNMVPTCFYWTNSVAGFWADAANWTNNAGLAVAPDTAGRTNYALYFNKSGTYTVTHNLGNGFLLNQLNFGGATATLSGFNLTLTNAAAAAPQVNQNSAAAITININVALGANTVLGGSGNGQVSLGGQISGPGSLTKTNSGVLSLSFAPNTYSGGTTISAGIVSLASSASTVLGTGPVRVDSGASLNMNGNGNVTNVFTLNGATVANGNSFAAVLNGPVTLEATSTFNITGGFSIGGNVDGPGGLVKIGTTTLPLTGTNSFTGPITISAGTVSVGGGGMLGSGTYAGNITNNAAFIYGSTAAQTLSGAISGSGTLTLSGTNALTLTGANSFTGPITISAGTLTVAGGGMLGGGVYAGYITNNASLIYGSAAAQTLSGPISGTGAVVMAGGGTLTLSGPNTYAGRTTISSGFVAVGNNQALGTNRVDLSGGGLAAASGAWAIANTINLVSNSTLDTAGSSLTLSGVVTNTGALTKIGAGTLTLSGPNTYGGRTTISSGFVAVGNDQALSTNPVDLSGGGLAAASGAWAIANTINLASNSTVDTAGSSLSLSGVVTNSGALTKIGAGTLTLTSANTYGGTTISNGTLAVCGSGTLGRGNVTVSAGTLALSNSVAIAETATLTIGTGAMVNLAGGVNATVNELYFGTARVWAGTWGSTASPAENTDDEHFAGAGMITVKTGSPNPATILMFK